MVALAPVPDEPISVIGYVRVSMAREEMISPELQRTAIEDWARRHGRRIVRWIEDLDATGRNFKRKVMAGIEAIESGEAREIAVWKYSRFGRNRHGVAVNLGRIEQVGGGLQSATEEVDARTAVGKLTRGVLMELAAFESDRAGEQWREALAHRVDRRLPPTGGPRFGYMRRGRIPDPVQPHRYRRDLTDQAGERYEPDHTGGTAAILADLYRRYVAGETVWDLVQWLNTRGIGNSRGRLWSHTGLTKYLDSGWAAGYLRVHDHACDCAAPRACPRHVLMEGAHEPVVDAATWQAYLDRRAATRGVPSRRRKPVYPLTGLVRCGHCRGAMVVYSVGGQRGYGYRCSRYVQYRDCDGPFPRRRLVEDAVLRRLREWAGDIDERAAVTKARQAARSTAEADHARLTRELGKIDQSLRRLARQRLEDDVMPVSVYEELRDELLASRADVAVELERARGDAEANQADYVPVAVGLLEEWDTLPAWERRDLLAKLIRHVTVYRQPKGVPPRVVVTPVWEPDDLT